MADISFDPKTWLSPGQPPPAPGPASDSFDVRSWVEPGTESENVDEAGAVAGKRSWRWIAAGMAGLGAAGLFVLVWAERAGDEAATEATTSEADAVSAGRQSRTLMVSSAAEIFAALGSAGVSAEDARLFAGEAIQALEGAEGEVRLAFLMTRANRLAQLQATTEDGAGVLVTRTGEGLRSETLAANLEKRITSVRGELDGDTFYTSAVAAGVIDSLIDPFANAFSFDFNFALEVKQGAVFEAAWEQAHNPSG